MNITNSKTLAIAGYVTSLVVANITAAKIAAFQLPIVGVATMPAGFLAIGVSFLFSDYLAEVHGKAVARRTVNATVGALVLAYTLVFAAVLMPSAPFYDAAAYNNVLSASSIIVLASIMTTLVSQNVDVSIFHWLRDRTNGRAKWLRNIGSTGVSQLVDTALFIVLGFVALPTVLGGQVTPLVAVPSLVVGQYLVKVGVAVLDTPLFYALTR